MVNKNGHCLWKIEWTLSDRGTYIPKTHTSCEYDSPIIEEDEDSDLINYPDQKRCPNCGKVMMIIK